MVTMSNKTYDALKYVALIALPAVIALYGVVGVTWEIPETDRVLTTAAAVNTCIGALLGISSVKHNTHKNEE